jgi:hypothetical protein
MLEPLRGPATPTGNAGGVNASADAN